MRTSISVMNELCSCINPSTICVQWWGQRETGREGGEDEMIIRPFTIENKTQEEHELHGDE